MSQDPADLTDEELAKQNWEMLRERYSNPPTSRNQLEPVQQHYCMGAVPPKGGLLPEYKPKRK